MRLRVIYQLSGKEYSNMTGLTIKQEAFCQAYIETIIVNASEVSDGVCC